MAINLSSLSPITTKATSLSNLVLVSSQATVGYQPQNPSNPNNPLNIAQQPPKFLFHYEGEQTVQIESDITDHYVEDNTAVQDQIALKPEQITTHGFIGELNDIPPPALQILKTAAEKLTTVGAYVPQLSVTANLAYANAFLLYQVGANALNSAISSWSSLGNLVSGSNGQSTIGNTGLTTATNQNKQQTAFQLFYGYWKERRLFTVQTPWAVFQNMAIKSLRAIQDAETDVITDFEITFKMIRQASTLFTSGQNISFSGRAASQAAGGVNLGTNTPQSSTGLGDALTAMG